MRYQVRILGQRPKPRRFCKPKTYRDHNFASSESLEGAFVLLASAPFYIGEKCIIEDTEDGSWKAIKRGRIG